MKKFILGLIIGLLIPAAAGYAYFRFGYAPVATASEPMPFEKTMARLALRSRINKEAPKAAPIQPTEDNLTQGAHLYVENCAFCHGLPDQPSTAAAKGMFPLPPQLLTHDEMITDDPAGVTFWKIKNGIRMTGMPGFGEIYSDPQLWQVSLFLANADKLSDSTKAALARPAGNPAQSGTAATPTQPQQQKNGRVAPKHDHDNH